MTEFNEFNDIKIIYLLISAIIALNTVIIYLWHFILKRLKVQEKFCIEEKTRNDFLEEKILEMSNNLSCIISCPNRIKFIEEKEDLKNEFKNK